MTSKKKDLGKYNKNKYSQTSKYSFFKNRYKAELIYSLPL